MARSKPPSTDRLNRTVAIGEIAGRAIDPLLRQRGFATSELIANWASIVPAPYDRAVMPDRLSWPRPAPDAPADGATLYVRVDPAHALGFTHERSRIRDAINRYFGFFLISDLRTSREPFMPRSAAPSEDAREPTVEQRQRIDNIVKAIDDEDLRTALKRLGEGVVAARPANPGRSK